MAEGNDRNSSGGAPPGSRAGHTSMPGNISGARSQPIFQDLRPVPTRIHEVVVRLNADLQRLRASNETSARSLSAAQEAHAYTTQVRNANEGPLLRRIRELTAHAGAHAPPRDIDFLLRPHQWAPAPATLDQYPSVDARAMTTERFGIDDIEDDAATKVKDDDATETDSPLMRPRSGKGKETAKSSKHTRSGEDDEDFTIESRKRRKVVQSTARSDSQKKPEAKPRAPAKRNSNTGKQPAPAGVGSGGRQAIKWNRTPNNIYLDACHAVVDLGNHKPAGERYAELACALCGGNWSVGTNTYIRGFTGLRFHYQNSHQNDAVPAKPDMLGRSTQRYLTEDQLQQIVDGSLVIPQILGDCKSRGVKAGVKQVGRPQPAAGSSSVAGPSTRVDEEDDSEVDEEDDPEVDQDDEHMEDDEAGGVAKTGEDNDDEESKAYRGQGMDLDKAGSAEDDIDTGKRGDKGADNDVEMAASPRNENKA